MEKIDNFTQYVLKSAKDFEQAYTIERQIFRFNKNNHFYTIFEKEIEYDFIKNSLLFVKNNMYYDMIIYQMIIIGYNINIIFMMIKII